MLGNGRRLGSWVAILLLITASLLSLGQSATWSTFWDSTKGNEAFALCILLAIYAALLLDRKLRTSSDLPPALRVVAATTIVLAGMAVEFIAILCVSLFFSHRK